ncbi:MAG TPA: hypothetical protein VLE97_06535 [Gaiellaceae bacterium]|nr:hypothetical protein [Gaiellaceae bacterium]
MTRRVHRGRKGDGWPKARRPIVVVLAGPAKAQQQYPDVCPQHARCGHVVCSIVWYCVEVG